VRKKRKETFAHRLVELISEPQFIKFEHMLSAVLSYKVSPFWGLFALGALGA